MAILGCVLMALLSTAEETETRTLDEALAFAREHQPQIRAALARVRVEGARSTATMAAWYPKVVAGLELLVGTVNQTTAAMFNIQGAEFARIAGRASVATGEWQPYPSTFATLGLRQEAYDFGRLAAQAAVHDALADAERANATRVLLDVRFAVSEAYYGVYAAKEILRAAEDAYARAKVHRDLAAAGFKSGMRPPIELTRAEADLARLDSSRIRATGGVDSAKLALATVIGAPDRRVDVAATLPSAMASVMPSAPELESGLRLSAQREPALARLRLRLSAVALEHAAIWAEYRPELYVQGVLFGYGGGIAPQPGTAAIGGGWLPSVPNYALGLVLAIPLLDFAVMKRAEVAKAQAEVLESELAVATQQVDASVREAYIQRDLALGALPALERSVQAAKDNWTQADARFRAGLGTSVELADAEALREDAEIQLALGRFALARARAVLSRVLAEGL